LNWNASITLKNISEARVIYIAKGDNSPGLFDWLFGSKRDDSGRYQLMLYTRPNNGLIEVMILNATNFAFFLWPWTNINFIFRKSQLIRAETIFLL
jgi:hypothetical protein